MNKHVNKSDKELLRQKAEELLKLKPSGKHTPYSESEILKLIYELEVHQIELEMQNEELGLSKIAAEEAAEKYQDLYEFAPTAYFTLSENGTILDMNLNGARILGRDRSHFLNSRFGSFVSAATRPFFVSFLKVLYEEKRIHECELILAPDDKKSFPIHLSGILDENSHHCNVTVMDITALKEHEAEILENEVQYQNLANSGLALIWIAGTDKLCTFFNKPWLDFTGRSLEQELGNGWAEGVHPDDFDRCLDIYVTHFDQRKSFSMEYRLRHFSGEYRWIIDLGTPNYSNKNEFVGFIGHCFDISNHKNIENNLLKKSAQLELMNQQFIGREQKMIELKKEVNELFIKLKQEEKYFIWTADE
ncbi:MAG: PAS domain S-box protein [Bacteroidota bacterium]